MGTSNLIYFLVVIILILVALLLLASLLQESLRRLARKSANSPADGAIMITLGGSATYSVVTRPEGPWKGSTRRGE